MKKTKSIAFALLAVVSLQFLTSCFGKFALVGKIYKFNDGIMGNDLLGRFVKSLVMWAMYIIPVYEIGALIDLIILNLIEFWTGSNPLAMAPGQIETQFVTLKGKSYKMTAEQGKMTILDLTTSKTTTLFFDKNSTAVSILKDGEMVKVADYKFEVRNFASIKQMNGAM